MCRENVFSANNILLMGVLLISNRILQQRDWVYYYGAFLNHKTDYYICYIIRLKFYDFFNIFQQITSSREIFKLEPIKDDTDQEA